MNTRCPPKRVPSAARFFTHCELTASEDNEALGSLQASPQAPGQTTGVAGARCNRTEAGHAPTAPLTTSGSLNRYTKEPGSSAFVALELSSSSHLSDRGLNPYPQCTAQPCMLQKPNP
ncbi:UNVERIFIED_CONTAM: hypothetical protein FKN15_001643 [Acipenser sinensis]